MGQVAPVSLQEEEFATLCLFGISSAFSMPKSPDFIGAVNLEMLRWALLVAHQGDWVEINPLVQKSYRTRVKGKRSLMSIDQPLPPTVLLAVPSETEDFFLFLKIRDVASELTLIFCFF